MAALSVRLKLGIRRTRLPRFMAKGTAVEFEIRRRVFFNLD
jgi:hypothetical protein